MAAYGPELFALSARDADVLVFVLQLVETEVGAAGREKGLVGALLRDAAGVEHEDAVHVANRVEPVGDDDGRSPLHDALDAALKGRLRLRVDAGGRFVHYEDDLGVEGG